GAHALGAAAYAARAAASGSQDALAAEVEAQLDLLHAAARAALARLPLLGTDAAGPLGSGLLTRGDLGAAIQLLQAGLR
ncbi:hypothetical protein ACFSBI_02485, partial [Amnibacterium endophyticum]